MASQVSNSIWDSDRFCPNLANKEKKQKHSITRFLIAIWLACFLFTLIGNFRCQSSRYPMAVLSIVTEGVLQQCLRHVLLPRFQSKVHLTKCFFFFSAFRANRKQAKLTWKNTLPSLSSFGTKDSFDGKCQTNFNRTQQTFSSGDPNRWTWRSRCQKVCVFRMKKRDTKSKHFQLKLSNEIKWAVFQGSRVSSKLGEQSLTLPLELFFNALEIWVSDKVRSYIMNPFEKKKRRRILLSLFSVTPPPPYGCPKIP